MLSWIISIHFSSGSAKNNTGIAFFELSYSLLAGTEKVRRMKVKKELGGRSHGILFTNTGLGEIAVLFGFFFFDLNLISFLPAFLSFSQCNCEDWVFQFFWSRKLATFNHFLLEVH